MIRIFDYSIISETKKAVKIQYVALRSMSAVTLWVPRSALEFQTNCVKVAKWIFQNRPEVYPA